MKEASGGAPSCDVIVVGGSGFIGTRLVDRIRGRSRVRIVDIQDSEDHPDIHVFGDVRKVNELTEACRDGETIVNLAAQHRDDIFPRSLYDDVNVDGARNCCEVARRCGIDRIIFTSTVAVYGFAEPDTGESAEPDPFNDYGRTKLEAEAVYRRWQAEQPDTRSLVIIRPTVVFGERNRGNVYNLLRQIASGRFVMVGEGNNRKSLAYVENVAACLEHFFTSKPGAYTFNYVDKPDLDMNTLVARVYGMLGRPTKINMRLPLPLAYAVGYGLDLTARITGRQFPISTIRIKKFASTTSFSTAIESTGFVAPVALEEALKRTVDYEFVQQRTDQRSFVTE